MPSLPSKIAIPLDGQYDLFSKPLSQQIKERRKDILRFNFRKMPFRVASTVRADFARIPWFDGETFYFGSSLSPDLNSLDKTVFKSNVSRLSDPIYRGDINFYPLTSRIDIGEKKLEKISLDPGYIEFFIDMLVGNLGTVKTRDGVQIWRRFGMKTDHVADIDDFYGVSKRVRGIKEIALQIMYDIPWTAPMKVTSGVSINNTVYGGLGIEKLLGDVLPKHMIECKEERINTKKAEQFFKKICPEDEDRHNLLLATVYPYFKRGNEKFFILQGTGGNGKSMYMRHFPVFLGESKFGIVDLKGMGGTGFDRSSAIAMLQGKLVLQSPESKVEADSKYINELKSIATADPMVARHIGGDSYSFRPEGVLFTDSNFSAVIGDTDADRRRVIPINFVKRRLTWDEMDPYVDWLGTIEGAASIFLYAYLYYIDECSSMFKWIEQRVDREEETGTTNALVSLRSSYHDHGAEGAYVCSSTLRSLAKKDKEKFVRELGLEPKVKRIGDKSVRVYAIANENKFLEGCEKRGMK